MIGSAGLRAKKKAGFGDCGDRATSGAVTALVLGHSRIAKKPISKNSGMVIGELGDNPFDLNNPPQNHTFLSHRAERWAKGSNPSWHVGFLLIPQAVQDTPLKRLGKRAKARTTIFANTGRRI